MIWLIDSAALFFTSDRDSKGGINHKHNETGLRGKDLGYLVCNVCGAGATVSCSTTTTRTPI